MFTKELKGITYIILSGILYGSLGYFGISLLQNNFSLANMLFWRFLFSSLFLIVMLIPQIGGIKIPLRTVTKALTIGSIFYASSSALYFMACKYISSGLAMVIYFIYPGLVAILNWILYKAKITRAYFFSFILITLGIILLADISQIELNIYGIFLAITSGLTYAFYLILSKKQFATLDPVVGSLTVSFGSAVIFLCISLSEVGSIKFPDNKLTLMLCLGNSFVATALPMVLMLVGLKYINSTKASILSVLEPVFTVICGCLLLGEILSLQQIMGIVVVLSGSLIICKNDAHI